MYESACCQGQCFLLFFLLVARFCETVAGRGWLDYRTTVFSLLLPVVFVLRPWLARDLISS